MASLVFGALTKGALTRSAFVMAAGLQFKFRDFRVKCLTESNDLKVNKTLCLPAKACSPPTPPTPSARFPARIETGSLFPTSLVPLWALNWVPTHSGKFLSIGKLGHRIGGLGAGDGLVGGRALYKDFSGISLLLFPQTQFTQFSQILCRNPDERHH